MIKNLYEFRQELNQKGIFFSFNGPVSVDILIEIGDTLKHKMKLEEASTTTILSVFSIVVEQLQNIHFYSAQKAMKVGSVSAKDEFGLGIIVVGVQDGNYFVLSGNPVANEKIPKLTGKLEKITIMDKKELRKYYKKKLRASSDEDSKGAGLGLIEMARKASEIIEYDFQKIDDNFSFFSLNIIIKRDQ